MNESDTQPAELFISRLQGIRRQIQHISRRHGLHGDEADDFLSYATLKLIDNDYALLRKYKRQSRLSTYLDTVLRRLLTDFIRRCGRWRPSAKSQKLGHEAVLIDTLLNRERFSLDETIAMLIHNHRVALTETELRDLAAGVPRRPPRRFEREDRLCSLPGHDQAEECPSSRERAKTARRVEKALTEAFSKLSLIERRVLRMRFKEGLTAAHIARVLCFEQRRLYTLIGRCLRQLRAELEKQGLASHEVLGMLGCEEAEGIAVEFGARCVELRTDAV